MTDSPEVSEWRGLLSIAGPVVVVQVGMMLMGVVDTLMVGHLSANALASVALGNLYVFNAIVIAMGALMTLDPLVAQAVGAADNIGVTRAVQRGLILAVILGIATTGLMVPAERLLSAFKQPPEILPGAVL